MTTNMGPGFGRDRAPEDLAEEIMNQPGEGLDDLLEGAEIDEDFGDASTDLLDEAFGASYDDGGDYTDF